MVKQIFVRHTSASLLIQENADPSAKRDLERWLNRLVPEGDPFYSHDAEGPDDMPAHVKAALTASSISIPIAGRKLSLGTWQGIYLWEHRRRGSRREVVVHIRYLTFRNSSRPRFVARRGIIPRGRDPFRQRAGLSRRRQSDSRKR